MKTYKSSELSTKKRGEILEEARKNGVLINECRTNGAVINTFILKFVDKSEITDFTDYLTRTIKSKTDAMIKQSELIDSLLDKISALGG